MHRQIIRLSKVVVLTLAVLSVVLTNSVGSSQLLSGQVIAELDSEHTDAKERDGESALVARSRDRRVRAGYIPLKSSVKRSRSYSLKMQSIGDTHSVGSLSGRMLPLRI